MFRYLRTRLALAIAPWLGTPVVHNVTYVVGQSGNGTNIHWKLPHE
jgi:hypothetical protein